MRATLTNFPMPPSINEAYANNPGRGRGRFKTAAYKSFVQRVDSWASRNCLQLGNAKAAFKGLAPGKAIHLRRVFHFTPARVITLGGRPKRCDTANFLKCLDDELARVLGIDDSMFWDGSEHKLLTLSPSAPEFVDLVLEVIPMPSLPEAHRVARLPVRKGERKVRAKVPSGT